MSTVVALYEEDGHSPRGRLLAASATPGVVEKVARLLLASIPAQDPDPSIAELDGGRRRALQMVVDAAEFIEPAGDLRAAGTAGGR